VRLSVTVMDASRNPACATCPTITLEKACPLLLEHHSSDGTAVTADCPLLQRVMPIDKRSFVLALLEINPSMCDRMAIGIVGNACI
jgi:hypothetical protein